MNFSKPKQNFRDISGMTSFKPASYLFFPLPGYASRFNL